MPGDTRALYEVRKPARRSISTAHGADDTKSRKSSKQYTKRTDAEDSDDGDVIIIESMSRKPTEQDLGSSTSVAHHDKEDLPVSV